MCMSTLREGEIPFPIFYAQESLTQQLLGDSASLSVKNIQVKRFMFETLVLMLQVGTFTGCSGAAQFFSITAGYAPSSKTQEG